MLGAFSYKGRARRHEPSAECGKPSSRPRLKPPSLLGTRYSPQAITRDQRLALLNRLLTEYAETHESALRPRAVKDRGARKRREAEARAETCEAEMTAMRTISTLVSELTTSIAITVMICGLMMMALG